MTVAMMSTRDYTISTVYACTRYWMLRSRLRLSSVPSAYEWLERDDKKGRFPSCDMYLFMFVHECRSARKPISPVKADQYTATYQYTLHSPVLSDFGIPRTWQSFHCLSFIYYNALMSWSKCKLMIVIVIQNIIHASTIRGKSRFSYQRGIVFRCNY